MALVNGTTSYFAKFIEQVYIFFNNVSFFNWPECKHYLTSLYNAVVNNVLHV